MWSSTACRSTRALGLALGLPILGLMASAPAWGAGSLLWSASQVTEPYFLDGIFHPTLQGSLKRDLGENLRVQTRLSLATEAYGLFEPERDPRGWDMTGSVLCGAVLPVWLGWLEASAGVGAVLGRTQGERFYRHVWSGGIFAEESLEYQRRWYADVGIPFQAQWLFGRDQEGVGLEYSGFLSREAGRWGIGICWQHYLGPAPRPKPARKPISVAPPAPEPAGEELEEED